MGVRVRLVLLTTAGNQGFIFASNRLREAVGASELVREATTAWVEEACASVTSTSDSGRAVVLQASSGRALVVTDGLEAANEVVWKVTHAGMARAPGLDLFGTSIAIQGTLPTSQEISEVFAAASRLQARRPSPAARFQRLPVVAACSSTDLPAAVWHSDVRADPSGLPVSGEEPAPMSAEVVAKRGARPAADRRMRGLLGETFRLVDIDEFFDAVDWVAVVHADGNGLGGLFQRAPDILENPAEVAKLSSRVQSSADTAFRTAAAMVPARRLPGGSVREAVPLVPLVVGGDDLTALVDAAAALPFVRAYLEEFGRVSAADELVRRVNDGRGLTAAAGIAVVKPHFPFSTAYELAEELCRNAKDARSEIPGTVSVHAVDVHVLFDSVVSSLDALRARFEVPAVPGVRGPLALHERPFFLPTDGADMPGPWRHRTLAEVVARAGAVRGRAAGRADGVLVTRSQLHALREELHGDADRAERRFADLWRRAVEAGGADDRDVLEKLAGGSGDPPRLIRQLGGDEQRCSTSIVDALELADLIEGAERRR